MSCVIPEEKFASALYTITKYCESTSCDCCPLNEMCNINIVGRCIVYTVCKESSKIMRSSNDD